MLTKRCPCCGHPLGRRGLAVDFTHGAERVPWYRYAAPRLACRTCGSALRTELRRVAWPILLALVATFVALRVWLGHPATGTTLALIRQLLVPAFALCVVITNYAFTRYVRADRR